MIAERLGTSVTLCKGCGRTFQSLSGTPVAMQRGTGLEADQVLENRSAATMTAALRPRLAHDAALSTDGNPSYRVVAVNLGIEAGRFVASHDGPGGGVWHVQNVNAYHSRLKGAPKPRWPRFHLFAHMSESNRAHNAM